MYERNKRNLERCRSFTQKIDKLCKRLDIYRNSKNTKKIDEFTKNISIKNSNDKNAINKLSSQKVQIKNIIAKSSPERALDPQIEPMITRFVENVEDIFNNVFDNITEIRAFELSLQGKIDIALLFAMTDSMITIFSKELKSDDIDLETRKKIKQAKNLQKEAVEYHKRGDTKNAMKKTKEAYYTALEIIPGKGDSDFESQYKELQADISKVNNWIEKDECELPAIKTLYKLSKKHAGVAHTANLKNDKKAAQKNIEISSLLISRAIKRLLSHIEWHKNPDENPCDTCNNE